jgi:hypothetical protein
VNHNVVRSVFNVFFFWWIALAIYGLGWSKSDWPSVWKSTTALVLICAFGVTLGVALIWIYIWNSKHAQTSLLQGENVRGLICSIGELPLVVREPVQAERLPDFSAVPDVRSDFFSSWFARYEKNWPAHVELMRVFLRIYEHHKALPATHIFGGHGGRTLLQHSMLAAYQMDKLAHTWSYTGLKDRAGKRTVLKLRNPDYKFNADDPLVALTGIAHDIGKIETYIFDENDPASIIGIYHEHDLTGARMIARLPQTWLLPDEDRQAILLAVAHYHHPMELPLSPDRRAIDDRTIALMELLIKADFVTSRVEARGIEPTEVEFEEAGKVASTETQVESDVLWNNFVDIISEHGRINNPDPRYNLATLCNGKGLSKPMLLIKDDAIRSVLVKRLLLQSASLLGDGRYQLTIDLLKLLDQKGILFRIYEGVEFSAENALWNVDFMTRPAVGAQPEKKYGWSAVIIMDPKLFPRIEQMEPYMWFAVIQRGTMGFARSINKKKLLASKKNYRPNLLEADESELDQQFNLAKTEFSDVLQPEGNDTSEKTTQLDNDEVPKPVEKNEDMSSEAAKPVAEPHVVPMVLNDFPWEDTSTEPETKPASVLVSSQPESIEEEPKRSIAPIDVKQGLLKAVAAAAEQGVQLRRLNENILVSNHTLNTLVPEIDWNGCRYKIEQMSKGGKLETMFVAMGESEDYALVFKANLLR